MSNYIVRPLSAAELQNAVDWSGHEGWNPGHHDAQCFRSIDPEGYLGGFLNGDMISSVSAVNYDDTFSFLGLYFVRPEYRGSGHGLEIAQHALARCGRRNMGLDGIAELQDSYRKSGFTFAHNNFRFCAKVADILPKLGQVLGRGITAVNDAPDALIAYDRKLFPAPRDAFLQSWLSAPNHVSRVYTEAGQIKGYATLRPCQSGFKVGPLFADDSAIALALLASLLTTLPLDKGQHEVFIDMPQPNEAAFSAAALLGLEKVFETARMYSDHEPDIDMNRIFGITTFELG